MDTDLILLALHNITEELKFISHGGRKAFMANYKGSLWYILKCFMCYDVSFDYDIENLDQIKDYKCDECIALSLKDKLISGTLDCLQCVKKFKYPIANHTEEYCRWYCEDCIKLPEVVTKIQEARIKQQEVNEKHKEYIMLKGLNFKISRIEK